LIRVEHGAAHSDPHACPKGSTRFPFRGMSSFPCSS
jgi:hypothetical protein